jgi:hypothetical protein
MPPKNWDREIWAVLSQIDVTEHAVRKGTKGFNPLYIPWAVVHHILMDRFAGHYQRIDHPLEILPDGSALTKVTISIRGVDKTAQLAVMDHKFNAISPVDARSCADGFQRCFVKTAGLFGFGLSLWITHSGEPVSFDTRTPEEILEDKSRRLSDLIGAGEERGDINAEGLKLAKGALDSREIAQVQKSIEWLERKLI